MLKKSEAGLKLSTVCPDIKRTEPLGITLGGLWKIGPTKSNPVEISHKDGITIPQHRARLLHAARI
ncbi:hypothetical protein NT6N_20690 [Oceaniferula spumae]|uniref:Uncharacterized protein n=1 Tax=Oceaniferula spumae TaxID=2979115 RepID=A0AAT9FLZ8_9BACT